MNLLIRKGGVSYCASVLCDMKHLQFARQIARTQTQSHVERMRSVETKLDAFWEYVDSTFLENYKKSLLDLIGVRITHREIKRTPPWEPEELIKKVKSKESMRKSEVQTYHAVGFGHQRQESTSPTRKAPINQKTKTRGQADPSKEKHPDETAEGEEGPTPSRQSIIKLPPRALEIMTAFFPFTGPGHTRGKVR